MDKKIDSLSGGEKSRVQLAKLMVSGANFLLLDEPTNHLDIASRERVEAALEAFEGTILVISHDRYFLEKIVDRIVEVQNPILVEYPGDFSVFWRQKQETGVQVPKRPGKKRFVRKGQKKSPSMVAGNLDLETRIEEIEAEKAALEQSLENAYRTSNYKKGKQLSRELRKLEERIEVLYEYLSEDLFSLICLPVRGFKRFGQRVSQYLPGLEPDFSASWNINFRASSWISCPGARIGFFDFPATKASNLNSLTVHNRICESFEQNIHGLFGHCIFAGQRRG